MSYGVCPYLVLLLAIHFGAAPISAAQQPSASRDKLPIADAKEKWGNVTFCRGGRIAQDGACFPPFALGCFCFNALCGSSSPLCASYFRDMGTPNTDQWNIWSYTVPLPDPSPESATLMVVSDPQPFRYQLNQSDGTPSGGSADGVWQNSVRANYDVLKVVAASHGIDWPDTKAPLYSSPSAPKYLEINGDLTEYWHFSQLSAYRQMYESDFSAGAAPLVSIGGVSNIGPGVLTFPVLGNHDYVNNFGNCQGVDGDCSSNAIKWLRTLLSPYGGSNELRRKERGNANFGWDQVHGFDADSLMYYYRMNNYVVFNLGFVLNDNKLIKFNASWLKAQLQSVRDAGYKIIIFSHAGPNDDGVQWPMDDLCNAMKDVDIAGIFIGHVHEQWGHVGSFDKSECWYNQCTSPDCDPSTGSIPVWRIGCPDYRHLMAIRLDPTTYTIGWLDAPSGDWTDQFRNIAGPSVELTAGDGNGKLTKLFTCSADKPGDCRVSTLSFESPTLIVPTPVPSPPPPSPSKPPPGCVAANCTNAAPHENPHMTGGSTSGVEKENGTLRTGSAAPPPDPRVSAVQTSGSNGRTAAPGLLLVLLFMMVGSIADALRQ